MWFKASAPGSLMLLGEYAVLQGKHALVCAIDRRITVTLSPRQDTQLILHSALGQYQTSLSQLKPIKPFQFVLTAFQLFHTQLKQGFDVSIESAFSDQVGFASSAAVTVATLSALTTYLQLSLSPSQLIQYGRQVVRRVQGQGSGADIAACVLGGMVAYRAAPFLAESLPFIFPITVVYSGHKTPTKEAIDYVQKKFAAYPVLFRHICHAIDDCARHGIQVASLPDQDALGAVMTIQQGLLDALGVNTDVLNQLIVLLRQQKTLTGVKLSGSGLGDCVIGLGQLSDPLDVSSMHRAARQMDVAMTSQGVVCVVV